MKLEITEDVVTTCDTCNEIIKTGVEYHDIEGEAMCRSCHEILERLIKKTKKYVDQWVDIVRCPHCSEVQEEETYIEGEYYLCPKCEREYNVEVRFRVSKE